MSDTTLHVDFTAIQGDGSLFARRDHECGVLHEGQRIELDDGEGTRCEARVLNPRALVGKKTRCVYASVLPVPGTVEHYVVAQQANAASPKGS